MKLDKITERFCIQIAANPFVTMIVHEKYERWREILITINDSKKYEDLKANDYFVGKIKIIELIETYKLKEKHVSRIIDIYKYKTEGYIPFFHSKKELIIGATYEIRGYMYEDGYLRSIATRQIDDK